MSSPCTTSSSLHQQYTVSIYLVYTSAKAQEGNLKSNSGAATPSHVLSWLCILSTCLLSCMYAHLGFIPLGPLCLRFLALSFLTRLSSVSEPRPTSELVSERESQKLRHHEKRLRKEKASKPKCILSELVHFLINNISASPSSISRFGLVVCRNQGLPQS